MDILNYKIQNNLIYDSNNIKNKSSIKLNKKLLLLIEDPINSFNKIISLSREDNDIIDIKKLIGKELNNVDMFFLIINGKIIYDTKLSWNSPIWNNDKNLNYNIIKIHYPLLGGRISDIIKSIIDIGKFFLLILQAIFWFIKLTFYWLPRFAVWLLSIINPYSLLVDSFGTLLLLVKSIILSPLEFIFALIRGGVNNFFSFIFGIFWGWDNTPNSSNDYKSKYFRSGRVDKKCYATANNGKIPFSIIMGTILCPPAGVFMEYGLTGWFQIIVCIALTCFFYVPGLLYALLLIYN